MMHKNSPHRISAVGHPVFITTVTKDRVDFFREPIFAELFVRDLVFTKGLKGFDLLGFTVMLDHIHILFQSAVEDGHPEAMRSIKTNFSRNANDILLDRVTEKVKEFENLCRRGHVTSPTDVTPRTPTESFEQYWLRVIPSLKRRFDEKYPQFHPFQRFEWQSSYRDHVIRDEADLRNHIFYIYNNSIKHGLAAKPEEWRWMWVVGMDKFPIEGVGIESLCSQ